MRAYCHRTFEDPQDGPYPTRATRFTSAKNRSSLKRKMRKHKKRVRQTAKLAITDTDTH